MRTDTQTILGERAGPLSRGQRALVAGFLFLAIPLGMVVLHRSALMQRRMGDLGCYLRAAWAIRTGTDPYAIEEENGWHYNYPPFLAIVMTPLADAPAGEPRPGLLPYPASVVIWYSVNVLCLTLGVHWLASALEENTIPDGSRVGLHGSRRWWALRLIPILCCIVPIGHTLVRGQVNLIVIMCLCASMAALIRGYSWRAGWWLAWPICIKVFPAFLLLFPLLQRNWRCLGGCVAGLLVGLVFIPFVCLGPERTRDYYDEFARVTLAPGLGLGDDDSRSQELTRLTVTDSQSFLAMLHNTIHGDLYQRPADPSPALRRIAYALGAGVLLLTLWSGRWGRSPHGPEVPMYLGALVLVMLFICPVCHLHYYSMATPLVMGLLACSWRQRLSPSLGWAWGTVLVANIVMNILPSLPGCEALRDRGLTTYSALLLWSVALIHLWKRSRDEARSGLLDPPARGRLAA